MLYLQSPTNNIQMFKGTSLPSSEEYSELYLSRTLDVIERSLLNANRVLAVRLDLRFPRSFSHPDTEIISNEYIRRFFDFLERELDNVRAMACEQNKQTHPHHLHYIWCREYDQNETKPHYHVLLLLNGAAYQTLGRTFPGSDNLLDKVNGSWAGSLGLHPGEGQGLVYVPPHACYTINRDPREGVPELFQRASYLCKLRSKPLHEPYRCFGSSHLWAREQSAF